MTQEFIGLPGRRRVARRTTGIVPRTQCSGPLFPFVWYKYAATALLCSLIGTNELGLAQDVALHGMFNV